MAGDASGFSFKDLVELFFLYGPFFITLFIMIYGIRHAKAALDTAGNSKPRDKDAVHFSRQIYVSVWIFSGILVIACCTWWFKNYDQESKKKFVKHMDISDAQPTDRFEPRSDHVFVRTSEINDPSRRRDEIVVINEKPFVENDEIEIVHKKGNDPISVFPVRISDLGAVNRTSYKLVLNNGLYQLKPKHPPLSHALAKVAGFPGINSAYAAELRTIESKPLSRSMDRNVEKISKENARPRPEFTEKSIAKSSGSASGRATSAAPSTVAPTVVAPAPLSAPSPTLQQDYWVGQLGQKRQTIGRQLEALDAMANMLNSNSATLDLLRAVPGSENRGETVLSLLLNLAKHQDKLLAYKANLLLEKNHYDRLLVAVTAANSVTTPDNQRQILLALTEQQWQMIASIAPAPQKNNVTMQQTTYAKRSNPVGSATMDGTKYFALISWPALTEKQVDCAAEKIFRHNIESVSLAGEQQNIKKNRSVALVFDSRAEASIFADSISVCGARTEFVYHGDRRLAAAIAR